MSTITGDTDNKKPLHLLTPPQGYHFTRSTMTQHRHSSLARSTATISTSPGESAFPHLRLAVQSAICRRNRRGFYDRRAARSKLSVGSTPGESRSRGSHGNPTRLVVCISHIRCPPGPVRTPVHWKPVPAQRRCYRVEKSIDQRIKGEKPLRPVENTQPFGDV